jgi:hypothetical protein
MLSISDFLWQRFVKIILIFEYMFNFCLSTSSGKKYDKQDQQGKAAFNERKTHTIQQLSSTSLDYFGTTNVVGI